MLNFHADKNNKRAFVSLHRIRANTTHGVEKFWWAFGKDLVSEANKAILAKPRGGRVYKYRGRRHKSSRAGESPANRSGAYRRSIGFAVRGWRGMEFGAESDYAGHLENGTSRMQARPGLGNAISDTERNGLNLAVQHLRNNLK